MRLLPFDFFVIFLGAASGGFVDDDCLFCADVDAYKPIERIKKIWISEKPMKLHSVTCLSIGGRCL